MQKQNLFLVQLCPAQYFVVYLKFEFNQVFLHLICICPYLQAFTHWPNFGPTDAHSVVYFYPFIGMDPDQRHSCPGVVLGLFGQVIL